MADIFVARSISEAGVQRHVVLKRVLAARSRDQRFATMFLNEARLAAQLQHPNIAQVHDIGKLGESYFYTMEYVHGQDLRNVLRKLEAVKRPFPINLALFIASSALSGLHHAHTRVSPDGKPLGIVHRDVTPSNVMLSYEGAVKLLDFGVAKATAAAESETRAGVIKGKIGYLSPEQARGGTIDRRADIFAAGILMHEMLTCKRLFKRDSDFNTMSAIINEPVEPPSATRSDVSPALDQLVLKALAKNPDDRYATAAAMSDAIEDLAGEERHILTANALARVMRELFGEPLEPWLSLPNPTPAELEGSKEASKPVTVTNQSVAGIEVHTTTMLAPEVEGSAMLLSDEDLEAQLDQAPALIGAPEVSGPVAMPGAQPRSSSQWSRTPPPMRTMTPPGVPMVSGAISAAPARTMTPPGVPAVSGAISVAPSPPAIPPTPRADPTPAPTLAPGYTELATPFDPLRAATRRTLIFAGVVAVVILLVIVIAITQSSTPPPRAAVTRDDAAVVATATSTADAALEPVDEEPATTHVEPATKPVEPASGSGATAAVAPPSRPMLSIAELVATSRWADALALCSRTGAKALSREERSRCGVAACYAKQRKAALGYYAQLGKSEQSAMDSACRSNGITLATKAAPTPTGGQGKTTDPCKNPAYVQKNPLRCQR
jgi:serine/threonine-protein kinase